MPVSSHTPVYHKGARQGKGAQISRAEGDLPSTKAKAGVPLPAEPPLGEEGETTVYPCLRVCLHLHL